jgi:hypothetical protein
MANAQEESLWTTEVRKPDAQASPPTSAEKFQITKRAVIRVGYGRGFIVSAGESRYVITAVHCLPRYRIPRPHLANSIPELTFRNALGPLASKQRTIWADLCAISLTDDFAAFSEPDGQVLYEQHEQYEKFTEAAMTIGTNRPMPSNLVNGELRPGWQLGCSRSIANGNPAPCTMAAGFYRSS